MGVEAQMLGAVSVVIVKLTTQNNPPVCSLEYVVQNQTPAPIWLVNDNWLIWRQQGESIELCYARGHLRPGAQVFGYFPPAVVAIEPGDCVTRRVDLTWPQPLEGLWNGQLAAAPAPGTYLLCVRVGYGCSPKPSSPELEEGVEASVFRWQQEAVSDAKVFMVPAYR
jgi:hypothetical protein